MALNLERTHAPRRQEHGPAAIADVLHLVKVDDRSCPMSVTMQGISVSGFAIRGSQVIGVGESHRFQFRFLDSEVDVDATCVHSARIKRGDASVILAGFDFDPLGSRAAKALAMFVDEIAAMAGLRQRPEGLFA